MTVKVDDSRDEFIDRVAELSREVSTIIHRALGSPVSPSRCDLGFQIVTLGVNNVDQLDVVEYTEAVRAALICCFLRQVRVNFGKYDELASAFTFDNYLSVTKSASDAFFNHIRSGYVVNVKRHHQITGGRVVQALIRVSDGVFEMIYL